MKSIRMVLQSLVSIVLIFGLVLPVPVAGSLATVHQPEKPSIQHVAIEGWSAASAMTLRTASGGYTAMVAAGYYHTVGLKSDGSVVAVGVSYYGQCDVGDWADITHVAANYYHTVGLKSDGSVVAAGWNRYGQCDVGDWADIVQVAAGYGHTVGLKSDGRVLAAGENGYGPCDVGDWVDIIQLAAGGEHTVGLKSDGSVVAVGEDRSGQCDVGDWADIVQLAADDYHTVGLKSDGSVVAVGDNYYGQCNVGAWADIIQVAAGYGHTVGLKSDGSVVAVGDNYYGQCNVGDWADIVQLAAGDYHTVGLKSDGSVVAVGDNYYGQCNVGAWADIIQVAAGYGHTVGLKYEGRLVAVGWNGDGQCDVGDWADIVQVAAGYRHTVGLESDGSVVAVGRNSEGQCDVGAWADITHLAAGDSYTVGLKSDGSVVAVGYDLYGQCDVGDWADIVQLAAGHYHTVGLKSDGSVVAVGWNGTGQCDVGDWVDIVQVTADYHHTVGLKSDGSVVAVGDITWGQCDVGDWTDIVQVAAGMQHTAGLKPHGSVVAVGWNGYGQCDVGDWVDIVQVTAGYHHTVGLKSDGSVSAVGHNELGQCNLLDWNLGGAAPAPWLLDPTRLTPPPIDSITLVFSTPMDTSSFSIPDDINGFTGPSGDIAVTSFSWPDSSTLMLSFEPQWACGRYEMSLGPDIANTDGNPMSRAYLAVFLILAPAVIEHSPSGHLAGPVLELCFSFSHPMDTTSFSIAEDIVSFTGPSGDIAVTGFNWLDSATLEITFEPQYAAGVYGMVVGPQILDPGGNAMDQNGNLVPGEIPDDLYSASFAITSPRLNSHSPPDVTAGPIGAVQFCFDRPMDVTSFSIVDDIVSFTGPSGDIAVTGFNWPDSATLEVTFEPQGTSGAYEMVVGPQILDPGGNAMDQNANLIPGEIPDDLYSASFIITAPRLVLHSPTGALVAPVSAVGFYFDRPMDTTVFSIAEDIVSFNGPEGDIAVAGFQWLAPEVLEVTFDPQYAAGVYEMVVGPQILDLAGNAMDQNGNLIPGEIPDDLYSASFTIVTGPELQTKSMVAACYHTVGLKSDGSVVAVGANSSGQCDVDAWTDMIQVDAGNVHTVGLKSDGGVVAMGNNRYGQCDVGGWDDIVQVSAGAFYTVGVRSDGTVVAVGQNGHGECDVGDWDDIVQVAAGYGHTVGLKSDGSVVAAGANSWGRLDVDGWTDMIQVAAGKLHTVALKSDGSVVAVGWKYYGQCDVGDWADIVQLAADDYHTVGLKSDGTVIAAGWNRYGQCDVGDWAGIVQVAAGVDHTVGLKSDGSVVAVGANSWGQCDVADWNLGLTAPMPRLLCPGGFTSPPVEAITLRFSHVMDISTFCMLDDINSFVGRSGYITVTDFSWADSSTLMLTFEPQWASGRYEMSLGPNVTDVLGRPMSDAYLASFAIRGPAVTEHSPSGYVAGPVGELCFSFSHPMHTTSFSIAEDIVSFSGPEGDIAVTGFNWLGPEVLELTFDPQYAAGVYEMVVGPQILDPGGNAMDQNGNLIPGEIPGDLYSASFAITAPRIVASTPDGVTVPPFSFVRFHFDRSMDTTSFSLAEDIVSFTGPSGDIEVTGFSWLDPEVLELTFDPQYAEGVYEMVAGPQILDPGGNAMDQDGDLVPGETPDDQYVARFRQAISAVTIDYDTTWGPEHGVIILDDLTVASGVSLTIEAGTIVKLAGKSSRLRVYGGLNALGTPDRPVILTSLLDDTAGGDTNGDGDATVPSAGSWQGVRFESYATGELHGVEIRYANTAIDANSSYADVTLHEGVLRDGIRGIYVWTPFARIEALNCLMINNRQEAVFMRASSYGLFRNCTIVGNGFHGGHNAAIHMGAATLIFYNCIVAFNRNGINHNYADPGDATVGNCAFYNPGGQNLVWGTSAPRPKLDENGNIESDPRFVDRESGHYELDAGSPCIDAGRGFNAPTDDILSMPRYDDKGMPNAGYGFPSYVDIGAFERQQDTAAGDLAVAHVTTPVPAFLSIGDPFTVHWTVTNIGLEGCMGSWVDRVYLSSDPYLSTGDILLEEREHSGGLSSGASYTETLTAAAPDTVGPRYVIVRTNADRSVPEPVEANNIKASTGVLGVNVPALTLETPVAGAVASRQWNFYRFEATPGRTVRFNLDASTSTGSTGLYVRLSLPPTLSQYLAAGTVYNQPDQEARISEPAEGAYYIGVYGSQGQTSYTLSAEMLELGISSVDPDQVGSYGNATVRIRGDCLSAEDQVYLLAADGVTRLSPLQVDFTDTRDIIATFDLAGANPGFYDMVVVSSASEVVTLPDAIEIVEGSLVAFEASLSMPTRTRPGRVANVRIYYTNTGMTDIRSPVLALQGSEEDCEWKLPWDEGWFVGPEFRVMGLSSEGFPTVLRPGQTESIVVQLRVPLRTGALSVALSSVGAVPTDGSNTLIDWEKVESEIQPDGVHPAIWATVFANLQSQIGDTWGDYVEALRQNAERWYWAGRTVYNVRSLFAMEMDKAFGRPTGIIAGDLINAETGEPTMNALIVARNEVDGETTFIGTVLTGSEGEWSIYGLPAGAYEIYVEGYYFEETPVGTLASDSDVSRLSLYARPIPSEPEPEPVHLNASSPSLTMDADGRLHVVWRLGAEIWHSYLDETGWVEAAPIPGAEGLYPSIAAADNLIDGTEPGLIAAWQSNQGNASEIRYAIARPVTGGGFEWSEPAALTNDLIHDSDPVLLLDHSGRALIVYQKSDWSILDDTDLYYDVVAVDSSGLIWTEGLWTLGHLHYASGDSFAISESIILQKGASLPNWMPLIGGNNEFLVEGTIGGSKNCQASLEGKLEGQVKLFNNRASGGINNEVQASWVTDKRRCVYVFDKASLTASASLSADIPCFGKYSVPPIFHAEAGVSVGGSLAGTATWVGGNFPAWPTGGDVSLGLTVGIYGEAWLAAELVKAKLSGEATIKAKVLPEFKFSQADIKLAGTGWLGPFRTQYSKTWTLYEAKGSLYPLSTGGVLEGLIIEYAPEAGTGSIYGPNSILADLSEDLYHDGAPAIAIGPSGEILLAWAKDLDPATGRIGNVVVVSGFDGSGWSEPLELPESLGLNSGAAIIFDASGNPVVVWTYADSSSAKPDSTTEELFNILMAGSIVYSVRIGGAWSTPLSVMPTSGCNTGAALGTTHDDRVLLTWLNHRDDGVSLMASFWDGLTWTVAHEITCATGITGTATVMRARNETILLWSEDTNDNPHVSEFSVFYCHYNGTWSAPELFSPQVAAMPEVSAQFTNSPKALSVAPQVFRPTGISWGSPPDECCEYKAEADDDPRPPAYEPAKGRILRPVSLTPEDKFGPGGYDAPDVEPGDEQRFILPGQVMEYRIEFWNDEDAPVPTQDAVIYDVLDPAVFDLSTFEFTRVGFLAWDMPLPGGQAVDVRIDCLPEMNLAVEVRADWEMEVFGLDDPTGKLVWWFHCIDPITGDYLEDPMAGFLPPFNPATQYELGWIEFRVKAWEDLPTGTRIENQAFVQFDFMPNPKTGQAWGPAPKEGPWVNTIDAEPPTSQVNELPPTVAPAFEVSWSGQDDEGGSGIASYDIFFRENEGLWTLWLAGTAQTSAHFEGEPGQIYSFYSIATDSVGHREDKPAVAEATTTTVAAVLFIITTDLPDGHVGVAYEAGIEAEGGTEPYVWSWSAEEEGQALPPGLNLTAETGVISGIPTEAGDFGFAIQVTDDEGLTATRDLSLNTIAAALAVIAGVTSQVNCDILAGVTITLRRNGTVTASTVSDGDGTYVVPVPQLGEYTVSASKAGFGDEAQGVSVTQPKTYTSDFAAGHGLIPNEPGMSYVLSCINLWQFGEPPCQLTIFRVLALISVWLNPPQVPP